MEEPTEQQPASTSSPAGRTEEAALKKIRITGRDWDMSDWPPEEITVEGIVMSLEGCGADEDRAAVVDVYGRELDIIGVRCHGSRVELVVDMEGPGR